MKLNEIKTSLTFDDILAIPQYSNVLPSQVDTTTKLSDKITLRIPILSAAMSTVTESTMAIAMAREGGLGVIHKNMSRDQQIAEVKKVKKENLIVGAAVAPEEEILNHVDGLVKAKLDVIVVDTAHGHNQKVLDLVVAIRNKYPNLDIIAGNVATVPAAQALYEAGANIIKVGIGGGSICTTRIVAGIGVPNATAIDEIASWAKTKQNLTIIADGGIKSSGDIVKAIGLGANAVMLGNLLAGTDETPGTIIMIDNKEYKSYVGMGSIAAMKQGSAVRYFQVPNKKLVAEGIEGQVLVRGKTANVLYQLVGGLRSGMGYTGSRTIDELRSKCSFTRITKSGLKESNIHSIKIK